MNFPSHDPILDAAFFSVGSCRGPERLAWLGGSWRTVRFPVLAVLLRHRTRGLVLFDTGYAPRYFDVLRRWPYRLLGPALGARLPVDEFLSVQMAAKWGVRPEEVSTVIVSHFHLDHVAGLRDLPNAEIICARAALDAIQGMQGGWRAARRAFHPALLPADFAARVRALDVVDAGPAGGFPQTWDVFGDGSLRAVALPGHAAGQVGLRFHRGLDEYFLVADACWHEGTLREGAAMHPLAMSLFWDDPGAGGQTLRHLQRFVRENPGVRVVPSHCPRAVSRHVS